MAEYDRNKIYSKKKFHPTRIKESSIQNRSFTGSKNEGKTGRESAKDSIFEITPKKQPTILLKAREPPSDDIGSSSKRNMKEENATNITIQPSLRDNEVNSVPTLKIMTKSMKLIDDGILCTDSLQDFISENSEFLTVGIVGTHGVGKSTIMNLLTQNKITEQIKNTIFKLDKRFDEKGSDIKILTDHLERDELKNESKIIKEVFKTQTVDDIEKALSRTQGIDIYITSNRLILLDCQPFASISLLEELIKSESKRTNLVSEFIPLENSGEIQGLQLTTFLMSVCHVLLLVEDWFLDSNVVRFIQTAEMLKPTISNPEDELTDHFPHLLIIHNKAQMDDFSPAKFRTIQQIVLLGALLAAANAGLVSFTPVQYSASPAQYLSSPAQYSAVPAQYSAVSAQYSASPAQYSAAPFQHSTTSNLFSAASTPYPFAPVQYSPAPVQYADVPKIAKTASPMRLAVTKETEDYDPNPQYTYEYDVQDGQTGDSKRHSEQRQGDAVQGSYSLVDPDGFRRIVDYTADPIHGFNAVVRRESVQADHGTKGAAPAYASSPSYHY